MGAKLELKMLIIFGLFMNASFYKISAKFESKLPFKTEREYTFLGPML